MAEGQPCDVLHPPHLGHVGLQSHNGLVTEVNFRILDTFSLLNCLLEGSKGGGVILTGGDEPAICSSLDQIQIIGNGNLMVDDGRLS